jgi:Uma2 family endonuclease
MVQSLNRSTQQPDERLVPQSADQRIVCSGRSWAQFKLIQKGFESAPRIRLSYFEGTIEILMPGREHEIFSWIMGHLVGIFLAKKGIFFVPTAAMTQEKEPEVSVQADQSFCIGSAKPIPDLSIEVVFTSGGVQKLAKYQALGVPEVWFWQDGVLALYHLQSSGYEQVERSQLEGLQDLEIDLLKRCIAIAETDVGSAIRTFQQVM